MDKENEPSSVWRWAPLGLVVAFLATGLAVWEPFPPGIWHDDGVYVLLGRSIAEGEGLRYVGLPGAPLAPKFPPLFPLLLALVWTFSPTFPENVAALGSVNLVLTAVASGFFFQYLRKILKVSQPFALSCTILVWISAHLWRVASVPLSEPLFLLLLLLALWAGGQMEARKGWGPSALFLLVGGLAFYARSLGVAVLVGGVCALLLRRRKREAFWIAAGALGILLPWVVWTGWAAGSIPEPLQDILGPYGGWLVAQVAHDPLGFARFALSNAGHLLARTVTLLLPGLPGPQLLYGAFLAPILILGLWEVYSRSRVFTLTLVFSFGILLVWPYQEIRLMVPFQPLLMLSLIMGGGMILQDLTLPRGFRRLLGTLALGWVVYFSSVQIFRLSSGWTGASYRIRSEALLDAARVVGENTPSTAVVGAPELWAGLHLFTGRTTVPSAPFRPLAGNEAVYGRPEQQYELWIQAGVTHLLAEHGGQVHGDALDRVEAVCGPGTIRVLDLQPGRILVALAWDEVCQRRLLAGAVDEAPGV